jgi:predicted alpha/beta-fold hydrolase
VSLSFDIVWLLMARQISAKQAIPYVEFHQTPYGVLLATSWGGHLGYFETGGSRWFAKPVYNPVLATFGNNG